MWTVSPAGGASTGPGANTAEHPAPRAAARRCCIPGAGRREPVSEISPTKAAPEGGIEPVAANWSRRFKNNLEKLHSGDPYEVAEVLRNLAIRDREKGLSAGEKRMITKARQILISELSFATEKSEDEAEALIDGILDDSHGAKVSAAQA